MHAPLEIRIDLRSGLVPGARFTQMFFNLLIHSRVHEKREHHRRWSVYGHGDRCRWVAQIET